MLFQEKPGLSCLRQSSVPGGKLWAPVVPRCFEQKMVEEFQQCCFSSLSSWLFVAGIPRAAHRHCDELEGLHIRSSARPGTSQDSGARQFWLHMTGDRTGRSMARCERWMVHGTLPLVPRGQGSQSGWHGLNTNNRFIPAVCLLETMDLNHGHTDVHTKKKKSQSDVADKAQHFS